MLRIREMQRSDISFAVRLSDQEDWGIPTRDFERILRLDPRGSYIAMESARKVGLATTVSYGKQIAWIGNVVVEKSQRGRHIGQALVKHAINYLKERRVSRIALYSFDENIEFYRKLGFVVGPRFARFRRERRSTVRAAIKSTDRDTLSMSSLLAMDKKAFGANRERLILSLLDSGFAWYRGSATRSKRSYLLAKNYADMYELGPWVSFGLRQTELEAMLRLVLDRARSKPVEITCPLTNRRASALLSMHHFRTIKKGHTMSYKRLSKIGQPNAIVAFGFLDKG